MNNASLKEKHNPNKSSLQWRLVYFSRSVVLKHLLVALLVMCCHAIYGQEGIFKNTSDFLNGNLFYADNKTSIRLHELGNKNHIELKHNDSTYSFLKKDIYGYCDKDHNVYRFFNNKAYLVLNPGELLLLYKRSSGTGFKNSPLVDTYFFSKDNGSPILSLTLTNIFTAFSENLPFTTLLELYYRSTDDLIAYDSNYKQYKLNRLLAIAAHVKLE